MLGHVDSGKCVSGDTLVQLADGRISTASSIFEKFKSGDPIQRPDGVAYEATDLFLLSTAPEGKTVPKRATHVWKLHAEKMIEVQTKAGYSVKCTPEHKFMVMSKAGNLGYVEAEKLSLGDHLILPVRVEVMPKGLPAVKESILSRLSDVFLIKVSASLNDKILAFSKGRRAKVGALVGDPQFLFHSDKGYYRASTFRKVVALMGLPPARAYDEIDRIKSASPKKRASHNSIWISLPKDETGFEALTYLVGLLYGDGVAESGHLANNSPYLMDLYFLGLEKAFGVQASKAWRMDLLHHLAQRR